MNKFIKERADESICKDHQPGKKAIMLKLIFVCSNEISEKIAFFLRLFTTQEKTNVIIIYI